MKRNKFLLYTLIALFSAFSGAVIWRQFELFYYFYNSKHDFLLIILITTLSGWLVFKYLNLHKSTLVIIQSVTLIIGIVIFKISYAIFQYFDILSLSVYLFSMLSAISTVSLIKDQKPSQGLFISLISMVVGALIQFFAQNAIPIWMLAILYIILNFANSKLKLENSLQWVYGFLFFLLIASTPIIGTSSTLYKSQKSYYDKVIYSQNTHFQTIDITEWKGQQWYYYDGINNFSTVDEWLFYEPLVHPVIEIAEDPQNVLVVGGDNGLAIREIIKHGEVIKIEHLILDTALYKLARFHELFTSVNQNALENNKVHSKQEHIFHYLNKHTSTYDIIILDIPDPVDLELNEYYTREFYELCYRALAKKGVIITQAGSPYLATQAYYCISRTMRAAQFSTLALHNQVLTMGEWGWIIGAKDRSAQQLKSVAKTLNFDHLTTRWLNNDAMNMMLSFGKTRVVFNDTIVNTLKRPVVHEYYTKGLADFN